MHQQDNKNLYAMKETEYKRLRTAVNKLNTELAAFAARTDEEMAILYEDAYTSFGLANVRLEWDGTYLDGCGDYIDGVTLEYDYDFNEPGKAHRVHESEVQVFADEVRETINFWRACLRRAIRYWEMDNETLDAIQDGTIEDTEE